MRKIYLILTLLGLIAFAAAKTNPSQEEHKEAISNKITAYMQESLNSNTSKKNSIWEKAGRALGQVFGKALADELVDQMVAFENNLLFSKSKVSQDGELETIAIGIFGKIFFTRKMEEVLEEGLLLDN